MKLSLLIHKNKYEAYFPTFAEWKYGIQELSEDEHKKRAGHSKLLRKLWVNMLVEVRELGNGSSFGELALLNDAQRSATIIWKECSSFAVLEKADFK